MGCSRPTPRHAATNWARRLKRVFGIEIETCVRCGGSLEIIASIEQSEITAKLVAHLEHRRSSISRLG